MTCGAELEKDEEHGGGVDNEGDEALEGAGVAEAGEAEASIELTVCRKVRCVALSCESIAATAAGPRSVGAMAKNRRYDMAAQEGQGRAQDYSGGISETLRNVLNL